VKKEIVIYHWKKKYIALVARSVKVRSDLSRLEVIWQKQNASEITHHYLSLLDTIVGAVLLPKISIYF
jgi:hypothetical protein